MLDPVWRVDSARLTSLTPFWNGSPPTIARIAPDVVSSDTIADSMPAPFCGSLSRLACSASDWREGSWVE